MVCRGALESTGNTSARSSATGKSQIFCVGEAHAYFLPEYIKVGERVLSNNSSVLHDR